MIYDPASDQPGDMQSYISHRGWIIDRNPDPRIGRTHVYHHEDYIGSTNRADGRYGYAASVEDAKASIDYRLDRPRTPHGVAFCTIREATASDHEDDLVFHLECRFEDGAKFAAVHIDHDREDLADFLAQAINGPPVVDLKAIEDIVFHQFYGGPLGGAKRRLAEALQAYLNALLRGQDAPDPTHPA